MNRLFHFASLLLLPSGLTLTACSEEAAEAVVPAPAPQLADLVTDTVKLAPVQTHLHLSGQVVANSDQTAPVYPVAGGVVEQVVVSLGDQVVKGQVLAVVRSTQVADLEQEATVAAVNLSMAQRELAAAQSMHADGMTSEQELGLAQAAVRTARAEATRVQKQRAVLSTAQGRYVVRAPLAGTVTAKHISAGMQFEPGQLAELFTLTNLDAVWVLADVYQADIARVRVGMPAEIRTLAYPDQVFTGAVDKVFNMLNPGSKSMSVRVRLPNPGHALKPGMYTRVQLTSTAPEQLPTVPAGSLVFVNGRRYALVLQESGKVETRLVEPSHTVGGVSFVRSGLTPGEQVVTSNPLLIYKELND